MFLICINDFPQSLLESSSYLYANDTCIFYQYKDIQRIEDTINKEFLTLCECFTDNKLSIRFGKEKECISKFKLLIKLNTSYGDSNIKQYHTVE